MTRLPIQEQITFFYTRDLAASSHFYEDVLGLPLALDQGRCRIYRVAGQQAYLGVCEREDAPQEPQRVICTFVTPDVDGWYAHLQFRGVEPEHPPRVNEEYRIYHFFVRDPGGYLVEFQRFMDDPWDHSR